MFMMRKTEIAVLAVLLVATFSLGFFTSIYFDKGLERNAFTVLPANTLPANSNSNTYSASIDIVAVDAQGQTGVVNSAKVEIQQGRGRVLFSRAEYSL